MNSPNAAPSPRKVWRSRLMFALQATVSLLLVTWLMRRIDFGSVRGDLGRLHWGLALAGAALFFGRNVLAAWRWQLLLQALRIRHSIATLFKHYMISYFASSVLPSAVAGDLGRALLLPGDRISSVAASVAVERLAGTLAVGIFAHALLFLDSETFGDLKLALLALDGLVLLGVGALALIVSSPGLGERFRPRLRFLTGFMEALKIYQRPGPLMFLALLLSLVFQALGILGIVLFGRAVGDATEIWIYFGLLPAVWLFSLIPISIGGFGLREGALIYLMTQAGNHANLLALFLFLMAIFQAVIGASLAPFEIARRRRSAAAGDAS